MKEAVKKVHVINIDPRASTVHWRFAEPSGRQLVLEIIKGELHFYENTLGVLTNSPSFEWHLTNLNNYVNLFPGTAPNQQLFNIWKHWKTTSMIRSLKTSIMMAFLIDMTMTLRTVII